MAGRSMGQRTADMKMMNRLPQDSIPDSDMNPLTDDPMPGKPPVSHDADDQTSDVEHDLDDLPRR